MSLDYDVGQVIYLLHVQTLVKIMCLKTCFSNFKLFKKIYFSYPFSVCLLFFLVLCKQMLVTGVFWG